MVLMRVLPAGRTRDAFAAAGVALFALPTSPSPQASPESSTPNSSRCAGRRSAPPYRLVPAPPPRAVGLGRRSVGRAVGTGIWLRVGLLTGLAALSVLACSAGAQAIFFAGWATAQEANSGDASGLEAPSRLHRLALPFRLLASVLSPPVRAVFVKDMLSLTRDMRQLSMLFIPLAVIGVFIANLRTSPAVSGMETLLFVQTLLIILAPISLRLALVAYVAENRAFWLVIVAPNSPRTALLGKYVFASALSLPIGLLAAGAYAWATHLTGAMLALSLGLVVCAMLAFSGIGVGASARFCDFSAENARFTMTAGGRLVVFAIQLLYMIVMGILNVGAWALIRFVRVHAAVVIAGQALSVLILSAGCVAAMLWWGSARLRSMEW